jgi:hypothetical protein
MGSCGIGTMKPASKPLSLKKLSAVLVLVTPLSFRPE